MDIKNTINISDNKASFTSKQCPFLLMTDVYHTPGTMNSIIEECNGSFETRSLLEAQCMYLRGDIKKAYALVKVLSKRTLCFHDQIGVGLLLSLCALDFANFYMWEEGRAMLLQYSCENENERQQIIFWLAVIDCALYDISSFPKWFQNGEFDYLSPDSYPFARYWYVRYLLILCDYVLPTTKIEREECLSLMNHLVSLCEPLISQTKAEKAILPEIYLRLICAIAYHSSGRDDKACMHIEKAFKLAIPDALFRPFVEHHQLLDQLVDQVAERMDKDILLKIRILNKDFIKGWVKLHNMKSGRTKSNDLTTREREVARLAVYGFSNTEIAERLHITLNTVKQTMKHAMNKTNCEKRSDLIKYI